MESRNALEESDENKYSKVRIKNWGNFNKRKNDKKFICYKFLKDDCNNQDCRRIHNFSLKYKTKNNDEFRNKLKQMNEDLELLNECKQFCEENLKRIKIIFISSDPNNIQKDKRLNSNLEKIISHMLNGKKNAIDNKKIYFKNFKSFLYNEFLCGFLFFTTDTQVLSNFMKICILSNLNINLYDMEESNFYCIKIQGNIIIKIQKLINQFFFFIDKNIQGLSFFTCLADLSENNSILSMSTYSSSCFYKIYLTKLLLYYDNQDVRNSEIKNKVDTFIDRLTAEMGGKTEHHNQQSDFLIENSLQLKRKPKIIQWENLSEKELECVCHTYFIRKDRNVEINWTNPLIQSSKINSKIKIDNKPFSKGTMRYAFYAYDVFLQQKIVAKIPIKSSKSTYNLDTLSKDINSITISQFIADEFNDRVINHIKDKNTKLINFVYCYIYEITDPNHEFKYYSIENFIEGCYEKYNNNCGWVNDSKDEYILLAQTFSHFSWQYTKGYLLITDLQGVRSVLTDPQIHCLDQSKYGIGNLGYNGMCQFFQTHHCNYYCDQPNLLYPKEFKELPPNFDFFVENYHIPDNSEGKIYKLCDLCRQPYKVLALIAFNKKRCCLEIFCKNCNEARKSSMRTAICIECNCEFNSSAYWFKMKRTAFPIKCMKCRANSRSQMRKELENKS